MDAASTVHGHLTEAATAGVALDLRRFMSEDQERELAEAFGKFGWGNLMGVFVSSGSRYPTSLLRVYRAVKNAERRKG